MSHPPRPNRPWIIAYVDTCVFGFVDCTVMKHMRHVYVVRRNVLRPCHMNGSVVVILVVVSGGCYSDRWMRVVLLTSVRMGNGTVL
jgi:hypothetical protein